MLIGLAGAAGAGKDTAAMHLSQERQFIAMALADPLYEMVAAMTGIAAERLADRNVKETTIGWLGASPRRLLQTIGTEWGRGTLGDDVWVKHLFRRMADAGKNKNFVVTDVRFANEAKAIRERGGRIIEIVRPMPLAGVPEEARLHPSEAGIPDDLVDAQIVNDTDIAGLLSRVDKAIEWLLSDTMAV